jgi:hypothetical protein
MRRFLARILAAFRRRPRPAPPRTHVTRDAAAYIVASWRALSADEIAEHRAAHKAERQPRRWLDRRR